MAQRIGGQGLGLPAPQNLYPSELQNTPNDWSTNYVTLAPSDVIVVPPGNWIIDAGAYAMLQWLDPVTGVWRQIKPPRGGPHVIFSDGVNYRMSNLTACPVSATIAGGGSGFTAATAIITANVGGSTWKPIVGGSLSISSIVNPGSGYTMPPLVPLPAGPLGNSVPATAYTQLTGTSVTTVSLVNFGAGYTSNPGLVVLLPNPADPNIGTITNATISVILNAANSGAITAALCTNNGNSLATISALTLTAAGGAGSGATITPNILQVVTGVTVTGAGTGISSNNEVISVGGTPVSTAVISNPIIDDSGFIPNIAALVMAVAGGSVTSVSKIYDDGGFLSTPTALLINNGITTAATTMSFIMGGTNATVLMQPAAG